MSEMWWEKPLGKALIEKINAEPTPKNTRVQVGNARRTYLNAKASRLTDGWATSNGSADGELVSSLTMLRARSRALVRDSSYAKRAKVIVVNNVVGTGIGMQAQVKGARGKLNARVNDQIEEAWSEWCMADSCHTGGRLHFADLERANMAQIFEAGEVFLRLHWRKFGSSSIPFAIELIEAERMVDEFMSPHLTATNGNEIRMGVEVDSFYRPVAYWIRTRHPNDMRFGTGYATEHVERVAAENIIHLCVIDRWPQTRGEPWMHTALRRLNDMDGYSEAEIVRARGQAVRMGIIESGEDASSFGEEQSDGSIEAELEPGTIQRLNPGEKWHDSAPTAPNPQLDPFMRYMLREVAAGTGPSYESISRDYSQSNYSSSRLALLDDRDLWRHLQWWLIRDFRERIHRIWMQQAISAGAIPSIAVDEYWSNPRKFAAVRFKPRGWTWIDPTKEVEAFKEAVKQGFTTVGDVIAQTAGGRDIEDVLDERGRELELMRERDLVFETSPEFYAKEPEKQVDTATDDPPAKDEKPDEAEQPAPPRRVFSIQR